MRRHAHPCPGRRPAKPARQRFWEETQPPVLNQVSPVAKTYRPGTAADSDLPTSDFITMANSPTVALTDAPVFPVGGIVDPPPSASGCANADYVGVSGYTLGNELLQAYKQGKNPTVDFKVYGGFTDRFLNQVIAETRGGDPNHVVVVGAHLDSVPAGPGINDDGSGTATLLAQAEELADRHYNLRQKVRFAWWGAEENGLVGSTYYASTLSQREVDKIDVMLDYDMLASPNYVRFIYDGDGNAAPGNPVGPEGSGKVEQVHEDYFRYALWYFSTARDPFGTKPGHGKPEKHGHRRWRGHSHRIERCQLASRRLPIVGP